MSKMHQLMKLVNIRKLFLLFSVFICSLCLFIFSIVIYASSYNTLNQSKERLETIGFKTSQAKENQEKMALYEKSLEEMKSTRYIGKPDRLKWINSLKAVADTHKIPSTKFTLFASDYEKPSGIEEGLTQSDLTLTPMSIQMDLLHEGDLYTFLDKYREETLGIFRVDECKISAKDNLNEKLTVGFEASCTITWLNYEDPRESKGQLP